MNIKILDKPCPNCKTKISLNFYRNREEIIRCPNCKTLLIENPKRKIASGIAIFIGIFLTISLSVLKVPIYIGLVLLVFSFGIALKLIDLMVIKKDLIIRNKQTNQISYVDNSDWQEIVNNSANKENNFEILENLST
jgi:uncharacterized paraquat-inducible protein A